MSRHRRALHTQVRALIVLAILALFSLLPESLKGRLATFGFFHRFTHIAAFCIAFFAAAPRAKRFSSSLIAAALLVGFGIALEFFQSAVYGNYPEYWDMRDDAWGVAFGWLLQRLAAAMKQARES